MCKRGILILLHIRHPRRYCDDYYINTTDKWFARSILVCCVAVGKYRNREQYLSRKSVYKQRLLATIDFQNALLCSGNTLLFLCIGDIK